MSPGTFSLPRMISKSFCVFISFILSCTGKPYIVRWSFLPLNSLIAFLKFFWYSISKSPPQRFFMSFTESMIFSSFSPERMTFFAPKALAVRQMWVVRRWSR